MGTIRRADVENPWQALEETVTACAVRPAHACPTLQTMHFRLHYSVFPPGRMWMLVHSQQPEILHAIFQDKAVSRLEGDLWIV